MQVYNYHHDTDEFVGISAADPSPMEQGQFLIPAFATTIAPPTPAAKQAVVFAAGAWSVVPDHRGEVWYAAYDVPVLITVIGDPAIMSSDGNPAYTGLLATEPPPPPSTKADLVAYANAAQWTKATGGYVLTIASQPVPFSTSIDSLTLMSGKVARLQQPNPPSSVNWQTGPMTFVSIPAADFISAATTISDYVQHTFDALPAIFAAINSGAITTTDQIDQHLTP